MTKKQTSKTRATARATTSRSVKVRTPTPAPTRAKAPAKGSSRLKATIKTPARAKALRTNDLIKKGPRQKSPDHSGLASSGKHREDSLRIAQQLKLAAAPSEHREERPGASFAEDGSPEGASSQEHLDASSSVASEPTTTDAASEQAAGSCDENGPREDASSLEHKDGGSPIIQNASPSEYEGDRSAEAAQVDNSTANSPEPLEISALNFGRKKSSDGQNRSPLSALLLSQMSMARLMWAVVTWQPHVGIDFFRVYRRTDVGTPS